MIKVLSLAEAISLTHGFIPFRSIGDFFRADHRLALLNMRCMAMAFVPIAEKISGHTSLELGGIRDFFRTAETDSQLPPLIRESRRMPSDPEFENLVNLYY